MFADYTSPGWYIGLVAAVVLAIVSFVWMALGAIYYLDRKKSRYTRQLGFRNFWAGLTLFLITFGGWVAADWPLKYDYHHYVEKTGVVTDIGNRLVSGGEGVVNQRFVFTINNYPYGVDDTRASLAKVGDTVTLFCKKEHQFGQQYANDGYGCRWGKATR